MINSIRLGTTNKLRTALIDKDGKPFDVEIEGIYFNNFNGKRELTVGLWEYTPSYAKWEKQLEDREYDTKELANKRLMMCTIEGGKEPWNVDIIERYGKRYKEELYEEVYSITNKYIEPIMKMQEV